MARAISAAGPLMVVTASGDQIIGTDQDGDTVLFDGLADDRYTVPGSTAHIDRMQRQARVKKARRILDVISRAMAARNAQLEADQALRESNE